MGSTWGTMLAVGAAIGGAVTMRFGRDVVVRRRRRQLPRVRGVLLWRMRARFSEERTAGHEHPPLLESMRETFRYATRASARARRC